MKRMIIGAAMLALVSSTALVAQSGQSQRQNQRQSQQHEGRQWHQPAERWDNGRHRGWGNDRGKSHRWARGERMGHGDWRNARRIDYREYRLRRPPQGYEWRRSNNRFVLVRISTGYIMSVIIFNGR